MQSVDENDKSCSLRSEGRQIHPVINAIEEFCTNSQPRAMEKFPAISVILKDGGKDEGRRQQIALQCDTPLPPRPHIALFPLSTSPILPLPPIASFLSPHRSMSPLPHGFISPLPRFPPLLAPYFTLSTLPPWIYFNTAPPPSSFNSVHMDLFHPYAITFFFHPCPIAVPEFPPPLAPHLLRSSKFVRVNEPKIVCKAELAE